MDPTTTLIVAVLLGPIAAAYDFCTNPAAPPQILITQFEEAQPNWQPLPKPQRPVHKHVYVKRG